MLAHLWPYWGHDGSILAPTWPSWRDLGTLLGHVKLPLGPLGSSWAPPGGSWNPVGPLLSLCLAWGGAGRSKWRHVVRYFGSKVLLRSIWGEASVFYCGNFGAFTYYRLCFGVWIHLFSDRRVADTSYVMGVRVGVGETHWLLRYTWPDPSLPSARPGRAIPDLVWTMLGRVGTMPDLAKLGCVAVLA